MKQLPSNRYKAAHYTTRLCRALGYTETPGSTYTRSFPETGTISIRPFCIKTDFPVAYDWITRTYEPHNWKVSEPYEQLEETYRMMLESELAQPFMILLNSQPIGLVDIYHGYYHELSLYYDMLPDDYVLQVIIAPRKKQNKVLAGCILQTCLHYFFSYQEVKCIISDPNIFDTQLNEAMNKTGFRLISKLDTPYKRANLYYCTLNSFVMQLT